MPAKLSWDAEHVRRWYDNDASYPNLAAIASKLSRKTITASAIEKYARRNWPTRQMDIDAKAAWRAKQKLPKPNHDRIRAGKFTLPQLASLQD